jgi:hypothetical protein
MQVDIAPESTCVRGTRVAACADGLVDETWRFHYYERDRWRNVDLGLKREHVAAPPVSVHTDGQHVAVLADAVYAFQRDGGAMVARWPAPAGALSVYVRGPVVVVRAADGGVFAMQFRCADVYPAGKSIAADIDPDGHIVSETWPRHNERPVYAAIVPEPPHRVTAWYDGRPLWCTTFEDRVACVAGCERWVAVCTDDGACVMLDSRTGRVETQFRYAHGVFPAADGRSALVLQRAGHAVLVYHATVSW